MEGQVAKGITPSQPAAVLARRQAKLDGPPLPDMLAYLYARFIELRAQQPAGVGGPGPITHTELRAWQDNTGRALEPWEVDVIMGTDRAWRKALADASARKRPAKGAKDLDAPPATAAGTMPRRRRR